MTVDQAAYYSMVGLIGVTALAMILALVTLVLGKVTGNRSLIQNTVCLAFVAVVLFLATVAMTSAIYGWPFY